MKLFRNRARVANRAHLGDHLSSVANTQVGRAAPSPSHATLQRRKPRRLSSDSEEGSSSPPARARLKHAFQKQHSDASYSPPGEEAIVALAAAAAGRRRRSSSAASSSSDLSAAVRPGQRRTQLARSAFTLFGASLFGASLFRSAPSPPCRSHVPPVPPIDHCAAARRRRRPRPSRPGGGCASVAASTASIWGSRRAGTARRRRKIRAEWPSRGPLQRGGTGTTGSGSGRGRPTSRKWAVATRGRS